MLQFINFGVWIDDFGRWKAEGRGQRADGRRQSLRQTAEGRGQTGKFKANGRGRRLTRFSFEILVISIEFCFLPPALYLSSELSNFVFCLLPSAFLSYKLSNFASCRLPSALCLSS